MSGALTLIPTPLNVELPLEPVALALLHEVAADPAALILVEELKVARQRWLRWGLPREAIERFVAFNEHSYEEQGKLLLPQLKRGARAVLMSDGGLPAFCDPGKDLVNQCHEHGVRVSSTPFPNSIALAVALSGFSHRQFFFAGFLPQKDPERAQAIKAVWQNPQTQVLMETPYRRQKFLEELLASMPARQGQRRVLLALELNGPQEKLIRGTLTHVVNCAKLIEKQEFVLVFDESSVH